MPLFSVNLQIPIKTFPILQVCAKLCRNLRFSTPFLHPAYTCPTFAYFIISPVGRLPGGKRAGKAVYPRKGNTVDMEWAGFGLVPKKIEYHILSIHTAVPRGPAVFLCSTHSPPFLFRYIQKPIILQKSAPRKKGLRSFAVRGKSRGSPLVLCFLKFGNEGGQAYGKGIQNPGL